MSYSEKQQQQEQHSNMSLAAGQATADLS